MGLDFQNLAYQGQNLDQFGPNLAIWSNLLVFEPQTSYLCQRNLIAIENNHWVRFQKFGLPDQKFGPIWPKFDQIWSIWLILALVQAQKNWCIHWQWWLFSKNVLLVKVSGLYFQNWLLRPNLAPIWPNLVHLKTCKGCHNVNGALEVVFTFKNINRNQILGQSDNQKLKFIRGEICWL